MIAHDIRRRHCLMGFDLRYYFLLMRRRCNVSQPLLALCVGIFAACSVDAKGIDRIDRIDAGDTPAPIDGGNWYKPNAATTWQWQLVDSINTEYDVDVYDIDLYNVSAAQIAQLQADGTRVICYFSAGSYEPFRPDSADFPEAVIGDVLDGFEDENWLDIRDSRVLDIMKVRLELAISKGCDGVEPDNVDGYQNDSGFALSAQDQLVFNAQIANEAHLLGLSVGLKNDLDQIPELVGYFDFSVNEHCHEYDECETLLPFVNANKPVWNAEYKQSFVEDPDPICEASLQLGLRTLILPLDLDDSFRISCD
ncbi:MAG: endo alpha-1,4 polygalactosaminidase [Myxococcales bacterium]|nr:endo alpha-1,4 polygalactosaminidase [Myxococcales bacterium]